MRRLKVSTVYLLARIRNLTAHSSQRLETVPDGVDISHAHEHHFTVWVVLYTHTHKTFTLARGKRLVNPELEGGEHVSENSGDL